MVTKVVVCGYGVVDSIIREPKEMEGLNEYYWGINQFSHNLILNNERVELVFTGGYTNPDIQQSEAGSARNFYAHMYDQNEALLLAEEVSKNASGNIVLGCLQGSPFAMGKLVIVCDNIRKFKTQVLCFILFFKKQNYEVISFPRKDISPKSNWWYQSTISLGKEIFSTEFWALRRSLKFK